MAETPARTAIADEVGIALAGASFDGAAATALPPLAQISFRLTDLSAAPAATALGLETLPDPNRFSRGDRCAVLWLGPDEFLAISSVRDAAGMEAALRTAIAPDQGAVVDVSAARVGFELAGPRAREVLASCCALDVHPRVFRPGCCASTLVAKAPVVIFQTDDRPGYRILVRPSYARYLADWLIDGLAGVRAEPGT